MKILVIGESVHFEECRQKFGDHHAYSWVGEHMEAEPFLEENDLIIDTLIGDEPAEFELYARREVSVFLNTVKISLGELANAVGNEVHCTAFGFNGLPTFINRPVLEVAHWRPGKERELRRICDELKTEYLEVDDRVGLVTPRVVCMIINEAYYTVQEGTATREDIDQAMKLGTNYPYGPFDWCARIGVQHVYETLEAIYDDTKDERYKICPLLRKEYLAAE